MSKQKAYEFFVLVSKMRQSQKNYFRAKKRSSDAKLYLAESKKLESSVDSIIKKANEELKKQKNNGK